MSLCELREVVGRGRGKGGGGVLRISPCINLSKAAILQPQHLFSIILTAIDFLPQLLAHFKALLSPGCSASCLLFDSFLVFGLPTTNLFVFSFIFLSFCVYLWPFVSLSLGCSLSSPPLMERTIPDFSSCNSVDEWLDTIKMSRYKDHFAAGGYHTLGHVIGMNQG